MQTDLSKAVANDESFAHYFPGGFIRLNRKFPPPEIMCGVWGVDFPKPKSPVYIEGSFLTDAPPSPDAPFGIQRYIAEFCGLAEVTHLSWTTGNPCRVTFESLGPVFGDARGN